MNVMKKMSNTPNTSKTCPTIEYAMTTVVINAHAHAISTCLPSIGFIPPVCGKIRRNNDQDSTVNNPSKVPESYKTPARHSCVTSHDIHSSFYDNGCLYLNGYIWENDIDDSLVVYGRVRELVTLHHMHLYHAS